MSFDTLIAPGKHKAFILDAKEVSSNFSYERVTEVTWDIDGDILIDKFRLDETDEKKKARAWRKLKSLTATLGLPAPIEGGRGYNELYLLAGKSCVIEVANFTADSGKTYHYVTGYMALPQKKPIIQVLEKPEPMGKMIDDEIPF